MKDKIPWFGGSPPLTWARAICYFGIRNGVILLAMAASLSVCALASGQALGLTIFSRRAWAPEHGFLLSSELDATLAYDSITAVSKFKVGVTGLESLTLELRWQSLPLRSTGKVVFLPGGFKEGLLQLLGTPMVRKAHREGIR